MHCAPTVQGAQFTIVYMLEGTQVMQFHRRIGDPANIVMLQHLEATVKLLENVPRRDDPTKEFMEEVR